MDNFARITQEYADALGMLGEIRARRLAVQPPVRPVRRGSAASGLGVSAAEIRLSQEEVRVTGLLARLDDEYRGCGGDPEDLQLAAGSGCWRARLPAVTFRA